MPESYGDDATINALSGTTDSESGCPFFLSGESPHYTPYLKLWDFFNRMAKGTINSLRLYKDGDLTFGVRAGWFIDGDTVRDFAAVTAQALTDDATNYIWLTPAGVLGKNTTGFPVPSTQPYLPLATIDVGSASVAAVSGEYNNEDISDMRGGAMMRVLGANTAKLFDLDWQESVLDELDFTAAEPAGPSLGDRYINTATGNGSVTGQGFLANDVVEWNGTTWTREAPDEGVTCMVEDRDMLVGFNGAAWVDIGTFALLSEAQAFFAATDISGAEAETLTDGSNGDGLHTHGIAGLDSAVQDLVPQLSISAGAEDGGSKRTISVQVKDLAGNNLAGRKLIRIWITAAADYGAPNAAGNTVAVETGTEIQEVLADAHILLETDATGLAEIGLTVAGAATRYIMGDIGISQVSTGAVAWAA